MQAEVEGSQVRRRVLHGMRDCDHAVTFGVGKVGGAVSAHALGGPQRLRQDVRRLLGDGAGRQQRSAGLLGPRELRTADPESTQSERGFIRRSAALRVGPERHAMGVHAGGVSERVVVCRAAARWAALRCTRAELSHLTAQRTAAARRARPPHLVPSGILAEIGDLVERRLGVAVLEAFLLDLE